MRRCLLPVLFAVPALVVHAEDAAAPYTLAQAFDDALARDPRIAAAESRVAEAREGLTEARSAWRPALVAEGDAGYAYSRNDLRPVPLYRGRSAQGGLRLAQSIPAFGRMQGRLRTAAAGIAEAEASAQMTRQDVLAETARHFVGQLYRMRAAERWRAFEALVRTLEQAALERVALGAVDRTEWHQIRVRLHRIRASRLREEAQLRVERMRLAQLTGAERAALAPSGGELAVPSASPEDALALAESNSPALARARQRAAAAQAEAVYREADLRPSLALTVDVTARTVGGVDIFDMGGGVRITVPLYEGGAKRSQLRTARLAAERARQELAAERERVEIAVRAAWEELANLFEIQADFENAVAEAQIMVELAEEKLEAGRATYVHYADARQVEVEAAIASLDNKMTIEDARIELLRNVGILHRFPLP